MLLRCESLEPPMSQLGQSLPSHNGIKFCDVPCWSDSCQGRECSESVFAAAKQRRHSIKSSTQTDTSCHSHLEKSLFAPVTKVTGLGSCGSRLSWLWGSALPKCLRQPQHLATAKPIQCCCLRNPDPLLCQIEQNVHPIDLRTAHQNHRHRPPAPHPIRKPGRVTSLSGPTVTSLSGVYTGHSRNGIYGMSPVRIYSGLMLAARMTLPHFSVSSAMSLLNSAGVPASTVPPTSARRALILGSESAALISRLSLSTISTGGAAAPAARSRNCLRWGPSRFTSFDHLVGAGEERRRYVEAERSWRS